MKMKPRGEKYLVKLAYEVTKKFPDLGTLLDNKTEAERCREKVMGKRHIAKMFEDLLLAMDDSKLALVIMSGVHESNRSSHTYLQTFANHTGVVLAGKTEQRQFVDMALPTLIAAVYDILHAERIIREKESLAYTNTAECSQFRAWSSWPTEALRNFVAENMKHRNTRVQRIY